MVSVRIAKETRIRRTSATAIGIAAMCVSGCAVSRAPAVTPEEIPALEARLADDPDNGAVLLRYAAALSAANRCDSARVVARRGTDLNPANSLGPLVVGHCLEQDGAYDQAIPLYQTFVDQYPDARGTPSVRARLLFAQREQATQVARAAIANEAQLTQQPADPQTVAVLPLTITGDSTYQPLGRGLAQIITSDLVLLQRFRMVERLQLGAVLDELQLSQTARVDQATAARVGRLMAAGRMVSGSAVIPSDDDMRLEARIVQSTGEVTAPQAVTGRFRDLMRMEKDLVVSIATALGYQLTQAERAQILENGTSNLAAFLAYSNGLELEDLGDYTGAAAFYTQAVRADPSFQEARTRRQTATAAPQVQGASPQDVTTIASQEVSDADGLGTDPVGEALAGAVSDLASTNAEKTTETADSNRDFEKASQNPTGTGFSDPESPEKTPQLLAPATIRIIFRLP